MKLNELKLIKKTAYLYEGLTPKHRTSMMLWESVGRAITEAQLSPQQISNLFQQVEQGASAAGGNRTLVGQGKDVADSVSKAYNDLKGKVANSATVQGFDYLYDQAADKLKQATGGDAGAMQYVEKYRAFAKAHPVAQSLIYYALIAAAGISGVGAGGAAALGLLKMTDKLLQGEKFSSAAYQGAKTGGMAYAAGQIGQAAQNVDSAGGTAEWIQPDTSGLPTDVTAPDMEAQAKLLTDLGLDKHATVDQVIKAMKDQDWPADWQQSALDRKHELASLANTTTTTNYSQHTTGLQSDLPSTATGFPQSVLKQYPTANFDYKSDGEGYWAIFDKAGNKLRTVDLSNMDLNTTGAMESRIFTKLEVASLFESIVIEAALWDKFKQGAGAAVTQVVGATPGQIAGAAKGVAGAVGQKLAQVGKNITTKVTADKLQSAWKAAGSPTDSDAIADILKNQGIADDVITSIYTSSNIARANPKFAFIAKMTLEQKQALLKQLDALAAKPHTGGKVAGQVSQTPNAIRQRQARATV
jgi:hypothetical protein